MRSWLVILVSVCEVLELLLLFFETEESTICCVIVKCLVACNLRNVLMRAFENLGNWYIL